MTHNNTEPHSQTHFPVEIRSKCPQQQLLLQAAADGDCSKLVDETDDTLFAARCTGGCTVLHWAAGCQQEAVVRYLVCERAMSVDARATRKSGGRTALHYACRNGHLDVAKVLVHEFSALVDARDRHGVTPFQFAVWRNHLDVCKWLVEECGVDPAQVNEFGCGAVHWLGKSPIECADAVYEYSKQASSRDATLSVCKEDEEESSSWGRALIPMARWLAEQPGIDFHSKQHTGHTCLHKAAWLGHLTLCEYLHTEHDMWDDCTDLSGNYAADLADMANTPRNVIVAEYLRAQCSRARAESCAILGISVSADNREIREAYKRKIRLVHPDKRSCSAGLFSEQQGPEFVEVQRAYQHLVKEGGRGSQFNPAHSLNLMLQVSANAGTVAASHRDKDIIGDDQCFKARLVAVLLEYGDNGINVSNLRRKWDQIWPDAPFPEAPLATRRRVGLTEWVRKLADDVIVIKPDQKGGFLLFPKNCTREKITKAAAAAASESRKG